MKNWVSCTFSNITTFPHKAYQNTALSDLEKFTRSRPQKFLEVKNLRNRLDSVYSMICLCMFWIFLHRKGITSQRFTTGKQALKITQTCIIRQVKDQKCMRSFLPTFVEQILFSLELLAEVVLGYCFQGSFYFCPYDHRVLKKPAQLTPRRHSCVPKRSFLHFAS